MGQLRLVGFRQRRKRAPDQGVDGVVGFGMESASALGAEDGVGAVAAIAIAEVFPAIVLLFLEGIERCLEIERL
ncbi:MAG: hypothetical protein CM15mP77_0460 [Synechococcus sp.]|nr:MAG: hypothetical protein CM15mP77_0460 [Synechococcus sp.]